MIMRGKPEACEAGVQGLGCWIGLGWAFGAGGGRVVELTLLMTIMPW